MPVRVAIVYYFMLKFYVIHLCPLFVFSSTAIAEVVGCKVFVSKEKKAVLNCLNSEATSRLLTTDSPQTAPVHVVPMSNLNLDVGLSRSAQGLILPVAVCE